MPGAQTEQGGREGSRESSAHVELLCNLAAGASHSLAARGRAALAHMRAWAVSYQERSRTGDGETCMDKTNLPGARTPSPPWASHLSRRRHASCLPHIALGDWFPVGCTPAGHCLGARHAVQTPREAVWPTPRLVNRAQQSDQERLLSQDRLTYASKEARSEERLPLHLASCTASRRVIGRLRVRAARAAEVDRRTARPRS